MSSSRTLLKAVHSRVLSTKHAARLPRCQNINSRLLSTCYPMPSSSARGEAPSLSTGVSPIPDERSTNSPRSSLDVKESDVHGDIVYSKYTPTYSTVRVKRILRVTSDELLGKTKLFCDPQEVLNGRMLHFTNHQHEIERDGVLRAAHSKASPYAVFPDAPFKRNTPKTVYFTLQPASDGVVLPYSWYGEPGGSMSCAQVDMSVLLSEEFKAFFCASVPTQYGFHFMMRVHTMVVFARKEHWAFCRENFVEIPKLDNHVLWFSGNTPFISSRILVDGPDGERRSRSHTVAVVVFGDLPMATDNAEAVHAEGNSPKSARASVRWSAAYGLKNAPSEKRGVPRIYCPICRQMCKGLHELRVHYTSRHTGHRFQCVKCDYSTSNANWFRIHGQDKHPKATEASKTDAGALVLPSARPPEQSKTPQRPEFKYSCSASGCDFVGMDSHHVRMHVSAKHDLRRYECDFPKCEFSSPYMSNMRRHIRKKHNGFRITVGDETPASS